MEKVHADDESSNRRAPELAWIHFMFSTYGTWLRGDARGFRDRGHRIHSSGDYANPPPPSEHAGLRRWVKTVMRRPPVRLDVPQRARAGAVLVRELTRLGVRLIVLAVAAEHVHGLGSFPIESARGFIGRAKRRSSHALRDAIPGTIWGKGARPKRIRDPEHQRATFGYIVEHGAREHAWVWTFRDPVPAQ